VPRSIILHEVTVIIRISSFVIKILSTILESSLSQKLTYNT